MKKRVMMGKNLNYVKSNNSFVNTGVSLNDNISIEIDFEGVNTIDNQALFGVWTREASFQVVFFSKRWYYGTGVTESNMPMPMPFTSRQIIKYNVNKKLYINDVECATLGVFPTISDKIWLFRRNLTYTDQPCPSYIKLYSFKIHELGKLIRDFVPAKKDNKYCLYDRVTKTYYYDQYDNLTI